MLPSAFPDKALVAEMTARMLVEVEAVRFQTDEPFRFTSGWASPVYIDCRRLISFPRVRQTIMDFAASMIVREIGFESIDAIAGGETAGIPFAAWLADRLMLPMQYVRKRAKGFGRDARIEGDFAPGLRILLVEDLTTDGQSKIKFCQALRDAGALVSHTFVIFHYDIFPETGDVLARMDMTMLSLATWWDVLAVCRKTDRFDSAALDEVERFMNDPVAWSARHGGASRFAASP